MRQSRLLLLAPHSTLRSGIGLLAACALESKANGARRCTWATKAGREEEDALQEPKPMPLFKADSMLIPSMLPTNRMSDAEHTKSAVPACGTLVEGEPRC